MLKYTRTIKSLFKVGNLIVIAILFLSFCTGCNIPKPYVNRQVDTTTWLQYESGKTFIITSEHLTFEFTITESQEDGVYYLKGTMDGSGGSLKSIDHFDEYKSWFRLLLANEGVIVDSPLFSPQGTDHTHKLPFEKKFKTVPFDSIQITYFITVHG